jgi:hypothetical protein
MRGGDAWKHDWMSWLPEPGRKIDGWHAQQHSAGFLLPVAVCRSAVLAIVHNAEQSMCLNAKCGGWHDGMTKNFRNASG